MEVAIVAPTLRMMGVVTILISFAGIFNNVLQASGMERTPLTALLIGGVLKMVTNYILVSRPEINIHGVAYGSLQCAALVWQRSTVCAGIGAPQADDLCRCVLFRGAGGL